jgi:hypothetical protein
MLLSLLALACTPAEEPVAVVEDPCPEIALDKLAGDWIKVEGSKGVHDFRVRVNADNSAVYVDGGNTRRKMSGELRENDLVLTEVPDAARKAAVEAGEDNLKRLYLEPNKKTCAVRASEMHVTMKDGKEIEKPVNKTPYIEFLPFPEGQVFSFSLCEDTLYVEEAAKNWKVAEKEIKRGEVNKVASLGESIPVAAWSIAAEDGDAACTYTVDTWFDGRPKEAGIAASAVSGERRQYLHNFNAPYSGYHLLEMHRYKQCDGGEKELIAVDCLEAVLD